MSAAFELLLTVAAGATGNDSQAAPINGWLHLEEIEFGSTSGLFAVAIYINGERVAPARGNIDGFTRINSGDLNVHMKRWVNVGDVILMRGRNTGGAAADARSVFTIVPPEDAVAPLPPERKGGMFLPWMH